MSNEPLLSEYASVRSEIQQLNGQVFAVLSSSISINIIILGWFFGKSNPSEFYALPTLGIFILFWGNIIMLNRNRLAHRLALFQKYFIESRMPDICWGRVYFKYRLKYPKSSIISGLAERLSESGTYMFFGVSVVNVIALAYIGLKPFFMDGSTVLDKTQVINFLIAILFSILQLCFNRLMTDYRPIDVIMRRISRQSGLTNH